MVQKIVIDPVTRIEGHAKITIQLNDAGEITGNDKPLFFVKLNTN